MLLCTIWAFVIHPLRVILSLHHSKKNKNSKILCLFGSFVYHRQLAKNLFNHRRYSQVVHRMYDTANTFRLQREYLEYRRSNPEATEATREVGVSWMLAFDNMDNIDCCCGAYQNPFWQARRNCNKEIRKWQKTVSEPQVLSQREEVGAEPSCKPSKPKRASNTNL